MASLYISMHSVHSVPLLLIAEKWVKKM